MARFRSRLPWGGIVPGALLAAGVLAADIAMEAAQSSRETVVVMDRPVRPAAMATPGALAWHEVAVPLPAMRRMQERLRDLAAAADTAVVTGVGLVREGGCG